jgi:hypothetical protein
MAEEYRSIMKKLVYFIIMMFCLGITFAFADEGVIKTSSSISESLVIDMAQEIALEIDAGVNEDAIMQARRFCTRQNERDSRYRLEFTHFVVKSVWMKDGDSFQKEYMGEIHFRMNCKHLQIRPGDD